MQRFTPVAGLLTGGVLVAVFGCPGPSPHEGPGAGGSGGAMNTGATSSRGISVTGSAVDSSAQATTGTSDPGTGGTVITSNSGVGTGASGQGGQGGDGGGGGMGIGGNTSVSAGVGGGPDCGPTQISCLGQCRAEDVDHCGSMCVSCTSLATNAAAVTCHQGACQVMTCKPTFFDVDGDASNGCEVHVERVFVTTLTYAVAKAAGTAMRGVQLGDGVCTGLANTFSPKWSAWLSDGSTSPKQRFQKDPNTQYRLMDSNHTKIATGFVELTSAMRAGAIQYDQTGAKVTDNLMVWTGTKSDGTALNHCQGWDAANPLGTVGSASATDTTWTQMTDRPCTEVHRLYCFEEDAP